MNYKTIIFDFDGTIVDTLPFTFRKILEIAHNLKLSDTTDKQILEEIRSKSYKQLMKDFKISWLKLPWALAMMKKMQTELTGSIHKLKPFPKIEKAMAEFKRKKARLGILTSNIKENVDRFLKANDLEFFDFIYCEKNFFGKDASLKNLIKKYRLEKESTVYVGDEIRDIEACKKAGVKIVAVTWGFNTKELLKKHRPDYLVDEPEELGAIFL